MKILVLGGTGAMGSHLVRILSDGGNEVFVTSRKERQGFESVRFLKGDAHESSFFEELTSQRWDAVVDFMVYGTQEFKSRHERLLDCAAHYVFLSSSRVYADSKTPITENSPRLLDVCDDKEFLATDEYALAKARQENILFESGKRNWTIIRPYITYSEQRIQLGVMEKEEWLFLALKANALIFSQDVARHTTTLTYGGDVAKGIASLIGKEEAFGEAFHITGNCCAIKWERVFGLYKSILQGHGITPQVYTPETCYRLESQSAKYQLIYDRYFDRVFDNSKIAKFVDTAGFKTPEEGLGKCLEMFLENGEFACASVGEGIVYAMKRYKARVPLSSIKGAKQRLKYILVRLNLWRG